ncbi:Na/Pi cotransporter family protein [Neisseria sp. Ec49-e6-T10]|uniref:Na/Pi cotransporter family protein n=1 Tax=Neisseria sp. Ec49-e6-T10 TaxID=3140744 RepID=UPI003EBCB861
MPNHIYKNLTFIAICLGILISFWFNSDWTQLCAGLALFLFGMQCLEEGLQKLAGGKLETILAKSTATPVHSMLFGMGATAVMQSTTLVSLLTIAFISTGLIQLASGIAIILGANLGATSGIWLLALAGQNLSLSPLALPMLVLGVLASFRGRKGKALGRVILGISFIFLGIDWIKLGFSGFTEQFDLSAYQVTGLAGTLIFIGIGLLITIVLQSSHATLMLTLAALASGQIDLAQSLAIAIGSNVGSSISTALVGMLGGNRAGQRLALAHLIFNTVTALLALLLINPLTWFVQLVVGNALVQLALFHTLFNVLGVGVFWPIQKKLAKLLEKIWPDKTEPAVLIVEDQNKTSLERIHARYINDNALASEETIVSTMIQEIQYLGRLSIEVICHTIYIPVTQLATQEIDESSLKQTPEKHALDAEQLYQKYIKGVYSDLLGFIGKIETPSLSEEHQKFILSCQIVALQLVEMIKDAGHLQKNFHYYLSAEESSTQYLYEQLRQHMFYALHTLYQLAQTNTEIEEWLDTLNGLNVTAQQFEQDFTNTLFIHTRNQEINSLQMSSLMNDSSYVNRIIRGFCNVLTLIADEENVLFHNAPTLPVEQTLYTNTNEDNE